MIQLDNLVANGHLTKNENSFFFSVHICYTKTEKWIFKEYALSYPFVLHSHHEGNLYCFPIRIFEIKQMWPYSFTKIQI